MKKKKIVKGVLLSLFAVIVVVAASVGIWYSNINKKSEKWDNYEKEIQNVSDSEVLAYFESDSEYTYDITDIEKEIKDYHDNQDDMGDAAAEWIETSEDVPEACAQAFDDLDNKIIEFFEKEYSVSVKKKFDDYNVKMLEVPEKYSVGGFYANLTADDWEEVNIAGMTLEEINKTIFINKNVIEYAQDATNPDKYIFDGEIVSTYIHETIHYLGLSNDDEKFSSITEGFTEALTIELMEYCGYDYELGTYEGNVKLASQMMMVDKEIVAEIIGKNDKCDEALVNALEDKIGKVQTEDLVQAHNVINDGFWSYKFYNSDYEALRIAQYLTAEYCKSFKPDDEMILEIYEYFLTPVNEI